METILQIASDFIEAQGMVAFIVVILAVLMYRDQTNRAVESKQQGETLTILRMEVSNNTATLQKMDDLKNGVVTKVDELKTDLIAEARAISDTSTKSHTSIRASIDESATIVQENTESVNTMSQELKTVAAAIQEVKKMLSEDGVTLNEAGLNRVADIVMSRLDGKFDDLEKCIKTTQETPAVKSDDSKPIQTPIATKKEEDTTE